MKKLILLFILLFFPSLVFAAGSDCTVTYDGKFPVETITFTCTADDAAATFPNTTTKAIRGYILLVETNPGTTGPTDVYDIVYNTASGVDVMGGNCGNRSITATERAVPALSGWVDGTLTQVVTNNAVNSATFTSKIVYWRQD
jgi:hypothetical protein